MIPRAAAIVAATALAGREAGADPLRLRADAFATTTAPAGLLSLEATGDDGANLSAQALVWTGWTGAATNDQAVGDVLVIALRARTTDGRASGQVGRFVAMLGALRPLHVDGASGRLRLPYRFDVEAYAGIPVVPSLATARTWDWATGGRVSRRLGDWGSTGIAYTEQRDDGRLATEEVGLDGGVAIGKHDDVGAKLAYDLINPGIAEATLTASDRRGAFRTEVFASYRAASHLLPATSLFTVLGDIPAGRVGVSETWRAAPRLDVGGDLAVRRAEESTAPELSVHAKLRLDDRGRSALGGELRRDGVGGNEWTGARATALIQLPYALAFSSELELVIPDHARGLGVVWPWALVALSKKHHAWDAAVAVEASASPTDRRRVDVLAQVGCAWGKP